MQSKYELPLPCVADFEVNGVGDHPSWEQAAWNHLTAVDEGNPAYETRFWALRSETGLYFLVECQDEKLTCTLQEDNLDLFKEDVVEVFLWTNENQRVYFEYEISPLGKELTLMVPNHEGTFMGWIPWHYEGDRLIRKAVTVQGGDAKPMASVNSWTCEFFIPFTLLKGLGNVPPAAETTWRANVYRIDYDLGRDCKWAWCPDTGGEFHNIDGFGTFTF